MNENICYTGLKEQHRMLRKELLSAIDEVMESADFILGHELSIFEKKIAKYCGVRYAVGVASGTDALFLSLKVCGIGVNDEVITVPNSFFSTTTSIINVGANPVYVDVADDMNINVDLIEYAITPKTKCIIPVHLTGRPARMDAIMEIAKKYNLFIIEDAAQAISAEYKGKRVGGWGDLGCFSFHPLKNLNACGDAGIITTDSSKMYEKLICLRNIGFKDRNIASHIGYNSRLDTLQAAILNVKFKYIDMWINRRREIASFYCEKLRPHVKVPEEKAKEKCVYHTFIIQTDRRDELKKFLFQQGIDTKIHYPLCNHQQPGCKNIIEASLSFPKAEKQAKIILSLPIYPELTNTQIEKIMFCIKNFFK